MHWLRGHALVSRRSLWQPTLLQSRRRRVDGLSVTRRYCIVYLRNSDIAKKTIELCLQKKENNN